jgi:predicted Ser/Thr protein kinase
MKNSLITAGDLLPSLKTECPNCGVRYEDLSFVCPLDNTVLIEEPPRGTTIFACYAYRSILGAGGGGVVFKAHHQVLDIEVAVKMLLRNHSDFDVRRFQQEAKTACLLQHENIVYVREFGISENGQPYMIMEFLDGQSLDGLVKAKGSLALDETSDIFTGVLKGMSYAHRKGVVHRDLKPSNIMLIKDQGVLVPKIVDFGIAKIIEGNREGAKLTRTGEVFGSPMFMSPEQALGKSVDFRTDIYSAGCVLFYVLTGKPPFAASTVMETLIRHVNDTPPTLAEAAGGKPFPGQLEKVVAKALAKNPADRYNNSSHFAAEFSQALYSKPIVVRTTKDGVPTPAPANRLPIVLVACSFAVAVLLVLAGHFNFYDSESKTPGAQVLLDRYSNSGVLTTLADLTPFSLTKSFVDHVLTSEERDGYNFSLDTPTTDAGVRYLADQITKKHAEIARLDLAKTKISNDSMEAISTLSIRKLEINQTGVTGAGLRAVSKISTLEDLRAGELNDITAEDLPYLGRLTRMRSLDLRFDMLRDFDLSFLAQLKHLNTLELSDTKTSNKAMSSISKLHDLNDLRLARCHVTDDGIKELRGLTSLHVVGLDGCSISTTSIRFLSKNQLWKLYLNNTGIDDVALELLHKQTSLAELSIVGCKRLTPQAVAALQNALPNCNIQGP